MLRVLVKQMMERCRISPAELLLSWTRGKQSRPSLIAALDGSRSMPPVPIGSRVRVRGGFAEMTISSGISAERIGKRGLNRDEFAKELFLMFFASEDPVMADLWTNQVMMVADATFSSMLRLVRGENFFKEIGILHFERWVGAISPSISADYTFPLKSKAQMQQQQTRRELGILIARRMKKREEELAKRQDMIKALGRQARHEKTAEQSRLPVQSRPGTAAARRTKKNQAARLRSLSTPKLRQRTLLLMTKNLCQARGIR